MLGSKLAMKCLNRYQNQRDVSYADASKNLNEKSLFHLFSLIIG